MSKYPDLYPYSAEEARRLNELDQWRESHRANIACKKAIEETISKGFDGMHLDHDCAKGVIQEYGYQRVKFVLANTLQKSPTMADSAPKTGSGSARPLCPRTRITTTPLQ